MNAEVKNRWTAALRSGEYRQGKRHLRHNEEWDALGVLCHVVDPEGWSGPLRGDLYAHRNKVCLPGPAVLAVARLREIEADQVARLGDFGADFEALAIYIEHHF